MNENNGVLNKIKRAITRGDVDYFEMFIKGSNISLKAALALVDVRVLDHIIVGPGQALSMAEIGLV